MRALNLGIVAHVDAGKSSLTERLLHATGVLDRVGSVDAGTTQTDSLALERERGITIRAAVATFAVEDTTVNLIDTPGHADFIAEVERSLHVLDGAVLVLSAVEGVQSQSVVLMRVLATALADVLIEHDDALLAAYVDGASTAPSPHDLRAGLVAQVAAARVHPVFAGSATTGAGIAELLRGIAGLLPPAGGDPPGPASGAVFKVERRPRAGKVAYVRMFSGRVALRDRLRLGSGRAGTVTAVEVFEAGGLAVRGAVQAGQIAVLSGLHDARVGDALGSAGRPPAAAVFAPPTLETAVVPRDPARAGALHAALARLAEQDPLIDLRQDAGSGALLVSLYGEVQKEVIAHALAHDAGIDVEFRATTTICIERPAGRGAAVERLGDASNPFLASLGLLLEPAPGGSGLDVRLAVDVGAVPLHVYRTVDAFRAAMTEYVAAALRRGPAGWEVRDCVVTVTECAYSSPGTTAADVRKLTPRVLAAALRRAGTVVCEPLHRFRLDVPADTLAAVLRLLAQRRAVPGGPTTSGEWCTVEGDIPAAEVDRLRRALGGRTRGAGVLESWFDRYEPVPAGMPQPSRARPAGPGGGDAAGRRR